MFLAKKLLHYIGGGDPGDIAKHALFLLRGQHIVGVHDVNLHLTLRGLHEKIGTLRLIKHRQARARTNASEQQTTRHYCTDDSAD